MPAVPPLFTLDGSPEAEASSKEEDSLSSGQDSEEPSADSASLSDAVSGSVDRGFGSLLTSETEGSEYVSTSVSPVASGFSLQQQCSSFFAWICEDLSISPGVR